MLAPLRQNRSRQASSTVKYVPPPVGGWNAKDALTSMKPEDAIELVNLIPEEGGVRLRRGKAEHCDGLGDPIQSLMEYAAPDGTNELYAAIDDKIFEVTTAGTIDPDNDAVVDTLTNGRWQHTMFATSGGNFLVACNGEDAVLNYNGSTWTTPTITGATSANLINVAVHMQRLWFVEVDSMKAWYLPTLSISGAATSIDFGGVSKLGGKLVAMASWTRDGGSGTDDLACFITSKGEVHLYQGTDPSSDATWNRVGTFRIAEPIGYRCLIKTGADVGILTSQGLLPLSTILPLAISGQARVAATDRIGDAFAAAYSSGGTLAGWQVIEFPGDKLLIVNVPTAEDASAEQYVMNTATGKWCKFTGLDAGCWSLLGDQLYFGGSDGTVWRYGGESDDGEGIPFLSVSAFNSFGTVRTKIFKRARPQFFTEGSVAPRIGIRLDYNDQARLYQSPAAETTGTAWDEGEWDTFDWTTSSAPIARWQGITGEGFVGALVVEGESEQSLTYNGSKVLFEMGDGL